MASPPAVPVCDLVAVAIVALGDLTGLVPHRGCLGAPGVADRRPVAVARPAVAVAVTVPKVAV